MSSSAQPASILEPPPVKSRLDSTFKLETKDLSETAHKVQISSLKAARTSKRDGSEKVSHSLVDLNEKDRGTCRKEQDVAEMEKPDASTKDEYRIEIDSVSPKPTLSQAGIHASQEAQGDNVPRVSNYEGLKDDGYLDPTPKTPRQETSPSRDPVIAPETQDEGSASEIQSIMDQFDKSDDNFGGETGQPNLGTERGHSETPMEHPPRRSNLEPLRPNSQPSARDSPLHLDIRDQEVPSFEDAARGPPVRISSLPQSTWLEDNNTPSSPNSSMSLPISRPPEPDPEPDLPFDFHRFLEQLRHRTADPVAKFLRSFLIEFGKKQWMVHEQVKIINDFLTFITNKMAQCEVWRGVSDAEFDNAKEGMEKLVMNRLYSQTFSPAIPAPAPLQTAKGKRKAVENALGSGRKGQHQEDIERDEILAQKVRIYGWVQEKHLDIPSIGDSGRRFLILAQQGEASHSTLQLHHDLTLQ